MKEVSILTSIGKSDWERIANFDEPVFYNFQTSLKCAKKVIVREKKTRAVIDFYVLDCEGMQSVCGELKNSGDSLPTETTDQQLVLTARSRQDLMLETICLVDEVSV